MPGNEFNIKPLGKYCYGRKELNCEKEYIEYRKKNCKSFVFLSSEKAYLAKLC